MTASICVVRGSSWFESVSSVQSVVHSASGWSRDLLQLAFAFGVLNFLLLGRVPLANPDEARYADVPRAMVESGDWVTPRLNATPYFEKPPLVYWLVGLCRNVFGPGETSARTTPALFGVAGVLLAYAAGRRLFGRPAGIAAAVVLGTSLLHLVLSRVLLLDMVVSVLMSAALYGFILAIREPAGARRRWLFHGLYAAAALATLTKGLIGFLIPGAVMFLWLLVFNQWSRLRPLYLPSGLLLFAAIAVPWHVLVALRNPGWAEFYFVHEHFARFTTTAHGRGAPFWYFVPVLVFGLFPWIGFLPAALRQAGAWRLRRQNADVWFFVTWAAFVFCFFSVSQSKLVPYLLPALPPLAVPIGAWLARVWEEQAAGRLRVGLGVFGFLCGLLAMAVIAATFRPGVIRDVAQAHSLKPFAVAIAAILLLGGVTAPWAARVRGIATGLTTVVAATTGFFLVILIAAPRLQRAGTKDLALVARERVAADDRVFHYWAYFHDFVYYARRPVGLVSYTDELEVQFLDPAERAARFIDDAALLREWAGPRRVWLVTRKRDQKAPKSIFKDAAFRYHLIAETRAHSLISNQP